jgi:ribosomal protein S18 acetylase RimI-like enzyme
MIREPQVSVRRAESRDLDSISEIGSEAFSGLRPPDRATAWVRACFAASPRMEYWVAEDASGILGYILWSEKGGFRAQSVLELEQVAVRTESRRKGVGAELIVRSLAGVRERLRQRGSALKLVEVTTGSEQGALEFYRKVLGAEVAAEIPDYFRGTEFILIARGQAAVAGG